MTKLKEENMTNVLDVGQFTFGNSEIAAHVHTLDGKRPETIVAQQRLLRKWLCQRDKMHAFTRADHQDVSAWQLEKIATLVDFAFSTHPFYHQLYKSVGYRRGDIVTWDDYNALPTIDKKDVIQNFNMFTTNLDQNSGENIPITTSGSSGKVLTVNLNPTSADFDMMIRLRFEDQMLGRERAPQEWFYQIYLACPPFTSMDGSYPTFTVSNECPPQAVLEHLEKMKPTIVSSIPSYLMRLANMVDEPNKLGIKAICTNSEPSTKAERLRIAEKLGAAVFDEYSSCELGLIATECSHGAYHIIEDNVRVDVLNPDANGMGEIIATNLVDSFMPLIRYRQGDILQIGAVEDICQCGNHFRKLGSFLGRTDQQLHSQVVGVVPSDLIMALYDRTLLTSNAGISEFQIIQDKVDRVKLTFVATAPGQAAQEEINRFTYGLRELFKDPALNIDIEEVAELPRNKSYKRRLIESSFTPK